MVVGLKCPALAPGIFILEKALRKSVVARFLYEPATKGKNMKRRFAVPAAIALTAHAVLFMGYGRPPIPSKPDSNVLLVENDDSWRDKLPPEPVVTTSDDGESSSNIAVIEGPPVTPEPPPTNIPTGPVITQDWVQERNGTATKLTAFNVGLPAGENLDKGAVTVSMLDDKPRTRYQKSPVYPRSLKSAGETGTVWVDFMVDERGYVHDARVVKSTNPGFNDVTLTAVAEWRFEPGKHKGIPVRFRMSLPMVFDITG